MAASNLPAVQTATGRVTQTLRDRARAERLKRFRQAAQFEQAKRHAVRQGLEPARGVAGATAAHREARGQIARPESGRCGTYGEAAARANAASWIIV